MAMLMSAVAFRRSLTKHLSTTGRSFSSTSGSGGLVAFIGLGNMGLPMAINLMTKGHKLLVFDKDAGQLASAKEKGAMIAKDISQVAAEADVIITMLPANEHVKQVYLGPEGLLKKLPNESRLLLDCSTVDPTLSQRVNEEAQALEHMMVDAPVSGGVPGAVNGTLTFMVGGTDVAIAEARCYLDAMGKRIIACGGPGKGSAVKVCNNLILGMSMLGVAEGYRLANDLGVNMEQFNFVVNSSSGKCWSSEVYNPVPGLLPDVPAARDYQGGFGTDLMVKDLGLALKAAETTNTSLPGTAKAKEVYEYVSKSGYGTLDFGSVYKYGSVSNKK